MVANTNNRVVIDASAILSYILPDEVTPKSVMDVFRKYSKDEVILLVPTLLIYEIGNALKSAVKQKRLNQISASEIIEGFKQLDIAFTDPKITETIEGVSENKSNILENRKSNFSVAVAL